jgi:RNA polymerase sigma factor (sigma-70 family)
MLEAGALPSPMSGTHTRSGDGDDAASLASLGEIYAKYHRGLRLWFSRQLGSAEAEDRVHDTFVIVAQAVRTRQIANAACLPGFIGTVARRLVAAAIRERVAMRRLGTEMDCTGVAASTAASPESCAIAEEQKQRMSVALMAMPPRQREVLVRFYLLAQPKEQICCEMQLTETQFRLLKSRAKSRLVVAARGRRW